MMGCVPVLPPYSLTPALPTNTHVPPSKHTREIHTAGKQGEPSQQTIYTSWAPAWTCCTLMKMKAYITITFTSPNLSLLSDSLFRYLHLSLSLFSSPSIILPLLSPPRLCTPSLHFARYSKPGNCPSAVL